MVRLEQSLTSLDEVLARVEKGEPVEVLRKGKPVARVSPVPEKNPTPEQVKEALKELGEFQERHTLGGLSVKAMIEEGRP